VIATFGVGQLVLTFIWFFLLAIEIWLMISVFVDIFRSHDLRGWAKAAWTLLVLLVPLVGILAYMIVRGDKMRAHQLRTLEEQQSFHNYFHGMANSQRSPVEELHRLAELRDRGDISADEYRQLKEKILRG
jgi:type VI protein secretion system component VasK